MKKVFLVLVLLFLNVSFTFSIDKDCFHRDWKLVNAGTTQGLRSVYFVNANTGWIAGWGSTVLKTTNAGKNWVSQFAYGDFQSITFVNANTGWIVGGGTLLYKTTNGGTNWISSQLPNASLQYIVKFVDENTGYISGNGGLVLKSTDGGSSWVRKITGTTVNLTGIDFICAEKGWIAGDGGVIKNTTDGGETWISQTSGTTQNIGKVDFINCHYGWISGYGGIVLRTTNGGDNWIISQTPVTDWLTTVYFFDCNNGFAAGGNYYGSSCSILKTTNGGINWCRQSVPSSNWLGLIFFSDRFHGWAVGNNGTILKNYPCGDDDIAVNSDSNNPDDFNLGQNYPNPFNPVTRIRFSLPVRPVGSTIVSFSSLKIFDISGREVQTLINEQLQPGIHEVTFDGSNFASGVYYYTLKTGDFTDTKRMMLVK
jgi:photosystem II stability/assembly factor-like uncharacterized protein